MTKGREKPSGTFWCVVMLAALIAYPASWGPACWLTEIVPALDPVTDVLFMPLDWLFTKLPKPLDDAIVNYLAWWMKPRN